MSHKINEYWEQFKETTTERGYTEEQTMHLGRMVVGSLASFEFALRFMDEVTKIEDGIQAQELFDRVFIERE